VSSSPKSYIAGAIVLALASVVGGCKWIDKPNASRAAAILQGRGFDALSGLAVFSETGDGLAISISVQDAPSGVHGVFICDGPTCATIGGHFNPERKAHGDPKGGEHHAGDLGNLTVNADGVGTLAFATQPAGDAGAKLACGEILADRR
jgi:superoxide dismutase, Cu-Zn family